MGIRGYAVVVLSIPFVSGRLLAAVGDDRSTAAVARAVAAALERASGGGAILGIAAYPPSLPFYLGRRVAVATATGEELTSTYIADYYERYRDMPGSPLRSAGSWSEALVRCPVPTVFLAAATARDVRAALGAALPLLVADGHYAAYGPCRAPRPPARPEGGVQAGGDRPRPSGRGAR
jgi:hypothetical protein